MNEKMKEKGATGSIIRWMWTRACQDEEEHGVDNVYDFTIGDPSVPAPKILNDSLVELLTGEDAKHVHSYTSSMGLAETRNAIADFLNQKYQANVSGDRIIMAVGAAASIVIGLNALLNEGEEVLTFAPHFPEYAPWTEKAGGTLKRVKTNDKFLPDEKILREAITEKTRVLLINSPNNPTGVFYDEEVIKMLARVLKEKSEEFGQPIYLFSDEPYRELLYVDKPFPFITKYYDYTLVAYSYSKSLSLPGERIGYLLTGESNPEKEDLVKALCGASRSLGYICASSLFQRVLPRVIGLTSDINEYKENRDILMKELTDIGYDCIVPEGAFYLFVKALEKDATSFAERATKYHIYFVASDSFGVEGYVRVSYCVDRKTIVGSHDAFKELFDSYRR